MGKMLDVARCRQHGGKLLLLCGGWYAKSTWTKQCLCLDRHYIWNSDSNRISFHDVSVCFMQDPGDLLTQTSAHIIAVEQCGAYISEIREFGGRSPRFLPVNDLITSGRLGANHRTIGTSGNWELYTAGFIGCRTWKLAVTHAYWTWSLLWIPQNFPLLLVINFLFTSIPANHSSSNIST